MKQKYPTKDATTLWGLTTLRISRARLLFMSMVLNSNFLTYNSKYSQVFHKQIRFHFCFQLHILKPIMSGFFFLFGGTGGGVVHSVAVIQTFNCAYLSYLHFVTFTHLKIRYSLVFICPSSWLSYWYMNYAGFFFFFY